MAKKKTLFAYVSGAEHADAVVSTVEERLDALVSARTWVAKDVWVVNQKEPPYWDLGVNVTVPSGKALNAGFLEDALAIAKELGDLHRMTSSSFVIGISDGDKTEDLFFVDSDKPELDRLSAELRRALALK